MPCQIIGEVAQAHDGSLGYAHAYIDAIAQAGAHGVKFQVHIAEAESTPAEAWRVKFSPQDATRYDYWKRMEFTADGWHSLRHHAHQKNLEFVCSPFSVEAVALIQGVGGADIWKIASGEVLSEQLLPAIAATQKPVFLSTGMSPWSEIDRAVASIQALNLDLTVLQCTSLYPTPPDKVGLNVIPLLKERYQTKVGLSDHTARVFTGVAAAFLGIDALEVHVTLSRDAFGPDVSSSLTPQELATLTEGMQYIEIMHDHPVDKDAVAEELSYMRRLFYRSLVARFNIPSGTRLSSEHIALKKPGTGIPSQRLNEIIGRRTRKDISADTLIAEEDLEPCAS